MSCMRIGADPPVSAPKFASLGISRFMTVLCLYSEEADARRIIIIIRTIKKSLKDSQDQYRNEHECRHRTRHTIKILLVSPMSIIPVGFGVCTHTTRA